MRSRGHFVKQYWNYYLELEHQVLNTRRYVEFNTKNYNTYSIEYIELLQAICSEIDVLGKVIAQFHNENFKVKYSTNIKQWGYEFQQAFPDIDQKCIVFDEMLEIYPFKNWRYVSKNKKIVLDEKCETPFWWLAYNSVKHARTSIDDESLMPNYQKANLKNIIYALGALFLMEKIVMKNYYGILQEGDGEFMPKKSKLFIVRL